MKPPRKTFGSGFNRQPSAPPPPPAPGLAARLAAELAISEVALNGRALDDVFAASSVNPKLTVLEPRDRALARSIATTAVRRLGTIRKALAHQLDRGLPKKSGMLEWTLVAGAAQLLFMDVADHAAVDLAVRIVKRDPKSAAFAGLANAVLRGVGRRREEILAQSDAFADDTPDWLGARWRKTYGEETAHAIAAANREEPSLDLSVKSDPEGWAQKLGGLVLPTGSVRLETHAPIAELEGYENGEWWVQDAGAALPARILAVKPGERVADLCAAPGGKTAQLALAGADVVAVDRSAQRLKRLAANMDRLNLSVETRVADATALEGAFDAILLDAPCTSTGTIRRHPDVAWTKRPSDIAALAALQARLLDRAALLLKPAGRLVYCTCSLEPEEGEEQIEALLRRNPDLMRAPIRAEEIAGLSQCLTPAGDLRTLPHFLPGPTPRLSGLDGFFAARLQRREM